ncbi:MAG: hypothetical protein BWX80_04102 [Candidatus Hydrogenedentes bacterium ADurb.Bin101]|nr:MAG: hypothetical protein BWX80_04102 [Candidatus Hydrogenedentes bacterium ADurb.Bin101]
MDGVVEIGHAGRNEHPGLFRTGNDLIRLFQRHDQGGFAERRYARGDESQQGIIMPVRRQANQREVRLFLKRDFQVAAGFHSQFGCHFAPPFFLNIHGQNITIPQGVQASCPAAAHGTATYNKKFHRSLLVPENNIFNGAAQM